VTPVPENETPTVPGALSKSVPVRVTRSPVAPMSAKAGATVVMVGAASTAQVDVAVEPSPLVSVRV
jgi:hypothetical protein